ncbi:MAG: FAD-binding oxidoreductase, partial [Flavobacteriales bacterium]|nr:FAD-binding oxidoreductase [Flavobacteriales bacterium]
MKRPLPPGFLDALQQELAADVVFTGAEERLRYGHDETEDLSFPPDVLVRPRSTSEVVAAVKLCARYEVPITPIGGRTGLSGGALSVHGGVAIALDRMDRILLIDEHNLQVTVEPGVITQTL